MRPAKGPPYRVAVVGASSLLGKEINAVLTERNFPVARLTTLESVSGDTDLPILDLEGDLESGADAILRQEEVNGSELDIVFLASHARASKSSIPDFLADSGSAT